MGRYVIPCTPMPLPRCGVQASTPPQLGDVVQLRRKPPFNYLELKAILLGLQSLCNRVTHDLNRVMTDNATNVVCTQHERFSPPPM